MTAQFSLSPRGAEVESLAERKALAGRVSLRSAGGKPQPDYLLFQPDAVDLARPPLLAVHGISRNAEDHVEAFAKVAVAERRLLVAPHFDKARFDGFQRLAGGTEDAVKAMWHDVESVTGRRPGAADIIGFSGGAQFAHRYAMLRPERVRSLILVAAGWYTFPSALDRFPYGIKADSRRGRRASENLNRFLAVPTLVLVGALDGQRDATLRKGADIDIKQGINRIERASRWSCAFLQAATRVGVAPTVQFSMLPSCGHVFDDCVDRGGLPERLHHWLKSCDSL